MYKTMQIWARTVFAALVMLSLLVMCAPRASWADPETPANSQTDSEPVPNAVVGQKPSADSRFLLSPTSEKYPNADTLFVIDDMSIKVNADGSSVMNEHSARKALNKQGAEELAKYLRSYDSSLDSVKVVFARVISDKGVVTELPNSAIVDRPLGESGIRVVSIDFGEVKLNSVVEYLTETTQKARPGKSFYTGSVFQLNGTVLLASKLEVSVPQGMSLYWQSTPVGTYKPKVITENGRDVYQWLVKDLPMPKYSSFQLRPHTAAGVCVSTCASWSEFSRLLAEDWNNKLSDASCLDMLCTKLTNAADPIEQRVRAIGTYIETNKNVILEFAPYSRSLAELVKSPELTSSETALLTTAMLRHVGVNVTPILVSAMPSTQLAQANANPEFIDSIMLKINCGGNRNKWLDFAEYSALLDAPSVPYQGLAGVVVDLDKSSLPSDNAIITLPRGEPENERCSVNVEAKIETLGNAALTADFTFSGDLAEAKQAQLAAISECSYSDRHDLIKQLVRVLNDSFLAKTTAYSHYYPEKPDPGKPLNVSTTVLIAQLSKLDKATQHYSMVLPQIFGATLSPLVPSGQNAETTREEAVWLPKIGTDEVKMHVTLPSNANVKSLPERVFVSNPAGSYYAFARSTGNEVWFTSRMIINSRVVAGHNIHQLQELAKAQASVLAAPLVYSLDAKKAAPLQLMKPKPQDSEPVNAAPPTPKESEEDNSMPLPKDLP